MHVSGLFCFIINYPIKITKSKFVKTTKNNYNVAYYMLKDFDQWNEKKKQIDNSDYRVNFHEREIWWCSVGINVGSEQDSNSSNYSRPVLILKQFTENIFLGIPLTTKIRTGQFRYRMKIGSIENDLLLMQIRTFDSKRLIRIIGNVNQKQFDKILEEVNILFEKTKTPFGVFSEAPDVEASVCGQSIANEISLSNELNYLLSRGEIS